MHTDGERGACASVCLEIHLLWEMHVLYEVSGEEEMPCDTRYSDRDLGNCKGNKTQE